MTTTVTTHPDDARPGSDPADADDLAMLFAAIGRGDEAALARLYQVVAGRLMGVAWRILEDEEEAGEVVQDVFIKVWEGADRYRERGRPWGWLLVLTRNAALDRRRVQRRRERRLVAVDDFAGPEPSLPEPGLHRCLDGLAPGARQAIWLCYVHGYSHRELQVRLVRPLGTIKAWIRRGLQELRQCLEH